MLFSTGVGTFHLPVPCKIVSVAVSNNGGGSGSTNVYRYQDTAGTEFIHVEAGSNDTGQVIFNGVDFPDGFSVVNSANVHLSMIEYEPMKTGA